MFRVHGTAIQLVWLNKWPGELKGNDVVGESSAIASCREQHDVT